MRHKVLRNSDATQLEPVAIWNFIKNQDSLVPGMCNNNLVVFQASVSGASSKIVCQAGKKYQHAVSWLQEKSAEREHSEPHNLVVILLN